MPFLRAAAVLLLTLSLSACQPSDQVYTDRLMAFGTMVSISLHGVDAERGAAASRILAAQLQAQHQAWSPREQGELGRLNAALARGESAPVSVELLGLLRRGRELSDASHGLFNPALGALVRLWGFDSAEDGLADAPPAPERIQALLARNPRMDDLSIAGERVSSRNPALQLDLGGYAKGYAVDQALATLRGLGIRNALVDAGGDLRVMGRRGERPWRIGIRDPRGAGTLAGIEVRDGESVFTSGDYERYFEHDGQRYHHILDPRTGYPSRGLSAATVVHGGDATTADAAVTALMVAGPEQWPEVAKAMGIRLVMVVGVDGRIQITPELAERMRWESSPAPAFQVRPLP